MTERQHTGSSYECPFLAQCSFIQTHHDTMPELVSRIMTNYCKREGSDCARRRIYARLGPGIVPELMLPDQFDWACQFIEEYTSGTPSAGTADRQ